jgi:integrase
MDHLACHVPHRPVRSRACPHRTVRPHRRARSQSKIDDPRRLSTVCGFYRYCEQERLIDRDPGAHVRRPKQDYESSTLGLDPNELGAFLVQARLSGGRDHALASLLALNGLRISEALGADIDKLELNRGHRTPVHPPQRPQDRHHPARTTDSKGARPLHRGTRVGADLPQR